MCGCVCTFMQKISLEEGTVGEFPSREGNQALKERG